MRFLYSLILVLLFHSTFFAQEHQKAKDPKMLGEFVFKSIQEENFDAFLSYIFTDKDCKKMIKNGKASKENKKVATNQMIGLATDIRQGSKENFNKIISVGKQKGIKWKEVKLTDIKYEIRNRDNIKSTSIFLLCKFNDKTFQIKLNNCYKSDFWLMLNKADIFFD
jgi:hypothetical protein